MAVPGFGLVFDESFAGEGLGEGLDEERWIPSSLPHRSTWALATARSAIEGGRLQLLIEENQPAWCPGLDGALRVSSLQTGLCAGAPGSPIGQHRFDPRSVVRW